MQVRRYDAYQREPSMIDPDEEVPMEQLLTAIADDWRLLQTLRVRLPRLVAHARRRGVPGRLIARFADMPEPTVRRMSRKADHREAGAA
jgi:hypothetical protein